MSATLAIFAIVALAIFLWAADATIWELVDGEPEEGAHTYPIIAGAAIVVYLWIAHLLFA